MMSQFGAMFTFRMAFLIVTLISHSTARESRSRARDHGGELKGESGGHWTAFTHLTK